MKIVLIRHGKVNYKWESWYNSKQFNKACSQYDQAPVVKTACSAPGMAYSGYYISTLPRTRETALSVFGEQEYIATDLINEVPLSASCNTGLRLPLLFWNVTLVHELKSANFDIDKKSLAYANGEHIVASRKNR